MNRSVVGAKESLGKDSRTKDIHSLLIGHHVTTRIDIDGSIGGKERLGRSIRSVIETTGDYRVRNTGNPFCSVSQLATYSSCDLSNRWRGT